MSEEQHSRKLNAVFGLMALVVGFSVLALVMNQPLTAATFTSITNSDGTLTISPSIGNVVASLNLGNSNSWTADQTFGNLFANTIAGLSGHDLIIKEGDNSHSILFRQGGTNMVQIDSSGNLIPYFNLQSPSGQDFIFNTGDGSHNIDYKINNVLSLQVDNNGNTIPQFKLLPTSDNSGQDIGTNALRWTLVRAVTITSGDLNFWPSPCGVNIGSDSNPVLYNSPGCTSNPLYTLTEDLTGKGLIFENHVSGQNQTMAMLNADGSPTPQFQQAVAQANVANGAVVVTTQTVTTTTTVTKIGP